MEEDIKQILNTHEKVMGYLEMVEEEDVYLATDGCEVEPDGHCPHGMPSILVHYGIA